MKVYWENLILVSSAALLLVSCGPQKEEEAPPPENKQEAPTMPMKQEEVPAQKLTPPQHQQGQNKGGTLNPEQKEQLEINEENVMNPFPG